MTREPICYGIANCDTVKRARAWLDAQGRPHHFHDFRKAGLPTDRLDLWIAALGWEELLNRRGLTWKKLDEAERARVVDTAAARALMLAAPSVIRRPVVEWPDGRITVGFDPVTWSRQG